MKTSKNIKRRTLEVAHPRVMQFSTDSLPGPYRLCIELLFIPAYKCEMFTDIKKNSFVKSE